MQMKLLLITCFLLGACTASYLAEKREGIRSKLREHDYFSETIPFSTPFNGVFLLKTLFPYLDAPLSDDTGHFKKLLSYFLKPD